MDGNRYGRGLIVRCEARCERASRIALQCDGCMTGLGFARSTCIRRHGSRSTATRELSTPRGSTHMAQICGCCTHEELIMHHF